MKPTIVRKRMLYEASQHLLSKQLGSPLSKSLKEKYHFKSVRVVEGDNVKVVRGEFKGIEGKVTKVSTEKRGIAIEGIKREKLKGGNVDIYIHPSNVVITSLNLEDKWRQNRLEKQKTKILKTNSSQVLKETKPKEQKEASKEKISESKKKTESKDNKPKKEIKIDDKIAKKEKLETKKSKEGK